MATTATKSGTKSKTTKPRSTKTTAGKAKTTRKTAAKPAAAKKAAAKTGTRKAAKPALKGTGPAPLAAPAPTAAAPEVAPVVVSETKPVLKENALRKKELLDEVAKRSGAKRKDCKPIVEAILSVLGEAIGEGKEVNLKPLGKLKVARTKQVANGRVINMRLRQSGQMMDELGEIKDAAE